MNKKLDEVCDVTRLLLMNDVHFRAKSDVRMDSDYLGTLLGKVEQVLNYSLEIGAHVLIPGDLFHSSVVSSRVLNEVINLLQEWKSQQDSELNMYVTPGNHDVISDRVSEYLLESPLGTLESIGLISVLHGGNYVTVDGDIRIYGFGIGEPETKELLDGLIVAKEDRQDFRVGLIHAAIGGSEAKFGSLSIVKCKIDGLDIACFGDIHDDPWFNYKHETKVRSFNPGALVRQTHPERDREVCFLEFEIAKLIQEDGDTAKQVRKRYDLDENWILRLRGNKRGVAYAWTWTKHKIAALPGDVVFDVQKLEQSKSEAATEFQAAIIAAKYNKSMEPVMLAQKVASEGGFSKESLDIVLKVLESV